MNRRIALGLAVVLATTLASTALAQGPGNLPPELQAKFQAWRRFNDNNKNLRRLGQTLWAFKELEKDPKTKFTKAQAQDILKVYKAWRGKPALTDDQARSINKDLTKSLTKQQIKVLATAADVTRGGRGFGGGARPAGGGPGGMGRAGQGMMNPANFPDPKPYNPLNPDTSPFKAVSPDRHKQMAQQMAELVKALEARAK